VRTGATPFSRHALARAVVMELLKRRPVMRGPSPTTAMCAPRLCCTELNAVSKFHA
jgi:hypothetical protein